MTRGALALLAALLLAAPLAGCGDEAGTAGASATGEARDGSGRDHTAADGDRGLVADGAVTSTEGRARAIVMEQLGTDAEEVTVLARLVEDLGADELDLVELRMAVEEEFGAEVTDEQWAAVRTVGDLIDLVGALTAPQ